MLKLLRYLYKDSPKKVLLISILTFISGLSGASLIAVIGESINNADARLFYGVIFCALSVTYVITKSVSESQIIKETQNKIANLRIEIANRILATKHEKLRSIGDDGLFVISTKDVEDFASGYQVLPSIISGLVVTLACFVYIGSLSMHVLTIYLVTMFFCIGGYGIVERNPAGKLYKARNEVDKLYGYLRGVIFGSRQLKLNSFRRKHFVQNSIGSQALLYSKLQGEALAGYAWITNLGNILFYQGVVLVIFILPSVIDLSLVVTTSIALVMLYLIRPIGELMYSVPILRQGNIAYDKIMSIYDKLERSSSQGFSEVPTPKKFFTLKLKDVCYSYNAANDEVFSMGPISLEISRGDVVFITGGNGSGKTTLAMMILGLCKPTSGICLINENIYSCVNAGLYREFYSVIFSDYHLFDDLPEVSENDIKEAVNKYLVSLQLDHKVKLDGISFSTTDLSSGQRKRLALISSFIENKEILLFDEWAADQDPEFKKTFYCQVLPELKKQGKTVIAITHDDQYFDLADKIINLRDGCLDSITESSWKKVSD